MKYLFTSILVLLSASSFAQFADTSELRAYIRDTIKDRRPLKVTAAEVQKGLLGLAQFIPLNSPLTSQQVGYGSSSHVLKGKPNFKFDESVNTLYVDTLLFKGIKVSGELVNTEINNSGVLSLGTHGSGSALDIGSGSAMLWYPKRSAFRAGYITNTQWDDANIGDYSVAFGYNTKANGVYSAAIGYDNVVTDTASIAIGYGLKSKFKYQTVLGKYNDTTLQSAFSVGWGTANNARKNLMTIDTTGKIIYTVPNSSATLALWKRSSTGEEAFGLRVGGTDGLFLGVEAGKNVTGQSNVAIGDSSMKAGVSGNYNTAMGALSLTALTTGSNNTAFGHRALQLVTVGQSNTAVGHQALSNLRNGNGNTAVGSLALRVAVGEGNTSFGYQTGYELISGDRNTFVGYQAGNTLVNGHGNVFIGYSAGRLASGSNELYIANTNTTTPLIYGDFANNILSVSPAAGKLGIRTKTPEQALHVAGQVKIDTITTGSSSDSLLTSVNGLVKKIAPLTLNAANGISVSSGTANLGQSVGQAGNPAALTSNREIPTNGHSIDLVNNSYADSLSLTANSMYLKNTSSGDDVISMTTNSNSFKRIRIHNTNAGADASAGFLFENNVGSVLEAYMGSGISSHVPNGAVIRSSGSGGLNIVADAGPIAFAKNSSIGANEFARFTTTGKFGIGLTSPTAYLHLKAGTATASTAPFKYTAGSNLTVIEDGAKEFDGTNEYLSAGGVRYTMAKTLTVSGTLDFLSTNSRESSDLTLTVTGAAIGDVVHLGIPNAAMSANICFVAFVSAPDIVTLRFNNYSSSSVDPASGVFMVSVFKY